MGQERRLPRAFALAALLLGLLALVALAAGGRAPLDGRGGEGRLPSMVFWDYVLSTAVVFFVLGVPLALWLVWISRSARDPRAGERRDVRALIVVAALCSGLVLASWVAGEDAVSRLPRLPTTETAPEAIAADEEERQPEFRWLPLVIAAAAVLALAAYYAARARRAVTLETTDEELADELAALVDDALDDLRREPDPRRAVIAAYARMERALAGFGLPRRPAESPLEYLQRLAPDLADRSGAARLVFELTHLYERAKFSAHAVDTEMKDNAIATLLSLRAELREAA